MRLRSTTSLLLIAAALTGCSGLEQRSASLHPGDTATVWFDPAVASAARAEIGDTGRVVGDDDRGLVVELPVANRSGFRSWLLSYLDRAEVLQPEALRDDVLAWLAALAGEEAP